MHQDLRVGLATRLAYACDGYVLTFFYLDRYPVEIFPPTDFHTSTYFVDPTTGKESIIIVGGLGYTGQASRSQTDVYQLDLTDFSIQRLNTSGGGPTGGTSKHEAELIGGEGQAAIKIMTAESKVFTLRIHDMRWI